MRKKIVIASILFVIGARAAEALVVPYLMGRVNDYAGILSEDTSKKLSATLKDFEKKTTCQIAVLTIKSLEGENLEEFSIKVAETWKLGQKKKDNGVLLLVAQEDRQLRIEVGYGLEGSLTDFACGRIISSEIVPSFKNGDYNTGITNGVIAIINTIKTGAYSGGGGSVPAPEEVSNTGSGDNIDSQVSDMPIATRIMIGIFIFSVLGIFTYICLFTKGGEGIFLYFFLIPFWAMFPMMAVGTKANFVIFGLYMIGIPAAKIFFSKSEKGRKFHKKFSMGFSSGGGSGRSSWSSSGSSGGGFSGGGGSFGGGGSSGRW